VSLAGDIQQVFDDMKTLNAMPDGWEPPKDGDNIKPMEEWDQDAWPIKLEDGEQYMADGLTEAIQKSLESGKTAGSIYNGSIAAGVVSGTVTGTFQSLSASAGANDASQQLYDAMQKMKDDGENANNDDLWQAIVDCCSTLVSKAELKELAVGTAINPSGSPVPAGPGTADGKLNDAAGKAPLLTLLKTIPAAMGSSGQDSMMVSIMAPAILTYFAAIIVNLSGTGAISGITATNVLVGNQ
jgi:hypothetical protein